MMNLKRLSGNINLNLESDSEPNLGITRLGMVRATYTAFGMAVTFQTKRLPPQWYVK